MVEFDVVLLHLGTGVAVAAMEVELVGRVVVFAGAPGPSLALTSGGLGPLAFGRTGVLLLFRDV